MDPMWVSLCLADSNHRGPDPNTQIFQNLWSGSAGPLGSSLSLRPVSE